MSIMRYKDYPQEVQDIIQQRVEEAGNVYNKTTYYSAGASDGGFTWSNTIEGSNFWRDVLEYHLKVFYKKYPKNESSVKKEKRFTNIPKDVKIGDKFILSTYERMNGSIRSKNIPIGEIVTLVENDESKAPYFSWRESSREAINWGHLIPYDEASCDEVISIKTKGFQKLPTDVKPGDKFVYVSHFGIDGDERLDKLEIGTIVEFQKIDPYFSLKATFSCNGSSKVLDWGYLDYYKESEQLVNNKNNNKNGKSHKQDSSSSILFGFTINLERGSTPRGEVITSPNKKITVGN